MGSNNKKFTENFEINSLAMAHGGASVGVSDYSMQRFLDHGQIEIHSVKLA